MTPLAENRFLLDPKANLTPSQIDILCGIAAGERVARRRNGWHIGGFPRKATTVRPLLAGNLLAEHIQYGRCGLRLTTVGRMVVDRLTLRQAPPGVSFRNRVARDD